MGTLTVRFDPRQMSVWSNRTGVHLFSDAQRNQAYIHAKPFFLEQMRILLEEGWRQSDGSNSDEVHHPFPNCLWLVLAHQLPSQSGPDRHI